MRLNRLLTYLNVLIGATLVLLLCVVYWFVYRVLPKTSGTLDAPVSAEASIVRDGIGVPHIKAASVEDALFLQGYATAQDRLWQMDALRRIAAGELSEILGKVTLEVDRESRRLRTRRLADAYVRTIPVKDRAYLAAYARGVNHFIDTHRKALPVEFTILRYEPRHWSLSDSVLVGLHMYRDLTTTWKDELAKARMRAKGDVQLVEQLFPVRSGQEFAPGSNAWAISGALTATGKPLLANDTHLEFALPSTWYMAHMQAPGLNVSGETLPGLPGVIIGHNDRIAWGVTNLQFDVQDLYIEQLNLANGQYAFGGAVAQARPEREYIRVKGERPVEFVNWVTRHGPILTSIGGRELTLRWVASELGTFDFPIVQLNMAGNWTEFRSALSRFPGPGQNFVYADVDGNIGYQASGRLPIRRKHSGDLPVDGSSGQFEWEGFVPFEDLPKAWNPSGGMIITANQNPFPADYKYAVAGNYAPQYRSNQIRNRIGSRKGWTAPDMIDVQKDVYSSFSHFLAKQLVAAVDRRGMKNEDIRPAVDALRNWNGQMEKDLAAPMITILVYQNLRRALSERAAPGLAGEYTATMAGPVVEKLLRERPKGWFQDYDQLLLRCLVDALDEGRRTQGRNPAAWNYGALIELTLRHPVGSRIPYIGQHFNVGPAPMSGSSTTVKQTTQRHGPSMRFVADLANWDNSLNNITAGQSGQFLSSHYKDQWDEYYAGKGIPMPWTRIEGSTLRVVPSR